MRIRRQSLPLLTVPIAAFIITVPGAAQTIDIPSTADPAQIPSSISEAPQDRPADREDTRLRGQEPVGTVQAAPMVLRIVRLTGLSVYDERAISATWLPYIDKLINAEDMAQIVNAITKTYQDDGYLLSRARFAGANESSGTLTIDILEGSVSEIRFHGTPTKGQKARLEALGRKITAERPLSRSAMDRYLHLMDDVPGIATSAELEISRASLDAPLDITVTRRTTSITAEFNNRGTRFIGPLRASVGARLNDSFGLGEGIAAGFITTPANVDELIYGYGQWQQLIGSEGLQLLISGAAYRSRPDIALPAPIDGLEGNGTIFSAALRYPLLRSRRDNLYLTLGYNHEGVTADLKLAGPDFRLYKDRIRSVIAGAAFNRKARNGAQFNASASMTKGIDIFGATSTSAQTRQSRRDGDATFLAFNLGSNYHRPLDRSRRLSLFVAASAQYSMDPLLAPEEFGLGGRDNVRAFDSSEFSGDSGIQGTVEARYQLSRAKSRLAAQLYTFYDVGAVWNRGARISQERHEFASAAGGGLRVRMTNFLDAYTEIAVPTDRPTSSTRSNNPRLFFGITLRR